MTWITKRKPFEAKSKDAKTVEGVITPSKGDRWALTKDGEWELRMYSPSRTEDLIDQPVKSPLFDDVDIDFRIDALADEFAKLSLKEKEGEELDKELMPPPKEPYRRVYGPTRKDLQRGMRAARAADRLRQMFVDEARAQKRRLVHEHRIRKLKRAIQKGEERKSANYEAAIAIKLETGEWPKFALRSLTTMPAMNVGFLSSAGRTGSSGSTGSTY